MSVVISQSPGGVFVAGSKRPELYTVATGSYATVQDPPTSLVHAPSAASVDTYLPVQLQSILHYAVTGKIVHVQGSIVLDQSGADPVDTSTDEIRVRTQVPSATEPGAWGGNLPLPAYGAGSSEPLLTVELYDENDTRQDGAPIVDQTSGTGPLAARILADGTLALLEVRNSSAATTSIAIAPVVTFPLTDARLTAMLAWSRTSGEARFIVHGSYLMQ